MFRLLSVLPLYLETLNNLEFEVILTLQIQDFEQKHGIFNNFNMFSSKNSIRHKKSII